MTFPRHRSEEPFAPRYSRREFLSNTGAAGAAIIAPSLVSLSTPAAARPGPGEARVLPAPTREGGMPLMQALSLRRSTREFSPRKLPDQVLSDLLWAAYGINRASGDRTAPSWRHVIVIDIYAAMEDGLWLYDPKRHVLVSNPAGDIRAQTGRQDFPAAATARSSARTCTSTALPRASRPCSAARWITRSSRAPCACPRSSSSPSRRRWGIRRKAEVARRSPPARHATPAGASAPRWR
jgi:hypothetical protein